MKTSEFNLLLQANQNKLIGFVIPSGNNIPNHFHITEVGLVTKQFIDCGGTVRESKTALSQIWVANDLDHRLTVNKLHAIYNIVIAKFDLADCEMEFEYGDSEVSTYLIDTTLVLNDIILVILCNKKTQCLALDKCGITGCC